MVNLVRVGGWSIGPGNPCFVIAEAGVNHNGDVDLAVKLIDEAVKARADAVKFQTFRAEALVSAKAPKAGYQRRTTDAGESQLAMIKRLELSYDVFRQLHAYCQEMGILFMSTPFDDESADFLDDLGVAVFKIPSGEITNLRFLAHVARKGKPMIVSTGMCFLGEVEAAVQAIEQAGNRDLVLLHCSSEYPANPQDVNLRAMLLLSQAFGVPVGYSDHTLGNEIPLAAVALGASVIEKHFTLDRNMPGPDHRASLEPGELQELVQGIRKVEAALGDGRKRPSAQELDTIVAARKSLVAACDIPAGTVLSEDLIVIKRPGSGLPPAMLPYLIGRTTKEAILSGDLISWDRLV